MTEVKGRRCFGVLAGFPGSMPCHDDCDQYTPDKPCPNWVPSKFWGQNICTFCIKNPLSCGSEPLQNPNTKKPMACYHFTLTKRLQEQDMVKLLNKDYDLRGISEEEITRIMQELCETYDMCRTELSTATLDVWACIVRVAKEIARRS